MLDYMKTIMNALKAYIDEKFTTLKNVTNHIESIREEIESIKPTVIHVVSNSEGLPEIDKTLDEVMELFKSNKKIEVFINGDFKIGENTYAMYHNCTLQSTSYIDGISYKAFGFDGDRDGLLSMIHFSVDMSTICIRRCYYYVDDITGDVLHFYK